MKKTFKIIVITIIVALIFSLNTVSAQTNILAKVVTDKTQVKAGEQVTVTVSITNIDQSLDGVAGFEGVIDYSSSVFEPIDSSNFTNKNGWTVLGFEKNTGHFTVINSGFVKEDQEMFSIILTAKQDVTAGSATINFTDLKTTALQSDIILSSKSVTLDVITASTGSGSVVENTNQTPTNNTIITNNNISNNTSNTVKPANTSTQTKLPKAGVETIVPVIVILSIAGYIFYRKNKNIEIE